MVKVKCTFSVLLLTFMFSKKILQLFFIVLQQEKKSWKKLTGKKLRSRWIFFSFRTDLLLFCLQAKFFFLESFLKIDNLGKMEFHTRNFFLTVIQNNKYNKILYTISVSEATYFPSTVGKKRGGSNSLCQGPITSSIDYELAKTGRRANHRRSKQHQPLQIAGKYTYIFFPSNTKGVAGRRIISRERSK